MTRGFRLMLLATGLVGGALCVVPDVARAQATSPYLGEIQIFAFNFCPVGWAPLNGQLLAISQNLALFAVLGTTYGGDGKSTFALPTAKPIFTATEATFTQCIALQGVFPSRS
jgi:microcystin-dependent protein